LLLRLNLAFNLTFESLELNQGFLGKVLRRRFVLLHALEVSDGVLSLDFLLVDDILQLLVLSVDLLENFFFEAFLSHDSTLHVRASGKGLIALSKNAFKLSNLT